jgi:hypothetical protein
MAGYQLNLFVVFTEVFQQSRLGAISSQTHYQPRATTPATAWHKIPEDFLLCKANSNLGVFFSTHQVPPVLEVHKRRNAFAP